MSELNELVEQLPTDLQEEVKDFVKFLMEKRVKKAEGKPNFQWSGALRDLRDGYTSVELQHNLAEWRAGLR